MSFPAVLLLARLPLALKTPLQALPLHRKLVVDWVYLTCLKPWSQVAAGHNNREG